MILYNKKLLFRNKIILQHVLLSFSTIWLFNKIGFFRNVIDSKKIESEHFTALYPYSSKKLDEFLIPSSLAALNISPLLISLAILKINQVFSFLVFPMHFLNFPL